MELPEEENIDWLMQSSATVEQVVADKDATRMRKEEAKQQKLFLEVLRDSFESEPIVDGVVAAGVMPSFEQLQTLLRRLKALGFFYYIRSSRHNKSSRKLLVKNPELIQVKHPYVVDRSMTLYCSTGREYTKQMRQRSENKQRVVTDCVATVSVKQVSLFCMVTVPKTRKLQLRTLSTLRKDMVEGKAPSKRELWVWISLPKMHHHPIILPGRQLDSEVKAAMHSLLQKGVTNGDKIQDELHRIVDQEFAGGPVKPTTFNTAFYPNMKVIYNHLRHEGLEHKKYQRRKKEPDGKDVKHAIVNRLIRLHKTVRNCSNILVLEKSNKLVDKLEKILEGQANCELSLVPSN